MQATNTGLYAKTEGHVAACLWAVLAAALPDLGWAKLGTPRISIPPSVCLPSHRKLGYHDTILRMMARVVDIRKVLNESHPGRQNSERCSKFSKSRFAEASIRAGLAKENVRN